MNANVLIGSMTTVAATAIGWVYAGSISGAGLWLAVHAPALIVRVIWDDFSCVIAAVRAGAWLGTMVVMMVVAGASRR